MPQPPQAEAAKQNLLLEGDGGAVDLVDLDLADQPRERAAATVGDAAALIC